ncbi:hypothetical protein IKF81_03630 [Candidatus Saccharibacteria bacterium]|nr:hypothetical protein [Candidatus Saccharibacteria bacterium]
MEEKIYFKPSAHEKATERKKPKPKEQKCAKRTFGLLRVGLALIFLIAIFILVLFLLRGKTTISSEKIPIIKSTSLSCSSNSVTHPIVYYDGAKSHELTIKMALSEDELKSIALEHSLFYDTPEEIRGSETHNHAGMNISFRNNNLSADAYNAKYTSLSDRMRINLYTTANKLDETAKIYFLIKTEGAFPTSATELRKNYESQGFICKTSE